MATVYLAGDAKAVAEVKTVQVTAYDAATTYSLGRNGKNVTAIAAGDANATATALAAAWNASTEAEHTEITASAATDTVTLTHDTAGKTFPLSKSVSGGTGTLGSITTATSAKGPEVLVAENCKDTSGTRTLPTNGDTFVIAALETNLTQALDALASVTTLVVNVMGNFTGEEGLPFTNTDGVTSYSEDRQRYLQTSGGTFTIGAGAGDGSTRVMIDSGSGQATFHVLNSDESDDDNHYAVVLKGTHASNTLKAESGEVDIAPFAGETATLLTLTATGDSSVRTSAGTTLGTVIADNKANVEIYSAAALTDITEISIHSSATVTLYGDNTATVVYLNGEKPTFDLRPSGAITIPDLHLYAGGTLDLDNSPSTVTITNLHIYGECTINDRNGKLLVTNEIANWEQVTFNGTPGRAVTLGDP